MTKKIKIIISISVVITFVIIFVFFFGMFWMMCHTSKSARKLMYNHYSDDANYVTIYGDAFFKTDYGDGMTVTITLSEECVQALNQNQDKRVYTTEKSYSYVIYEINHKALKENGFYGALDEVIRDNNTTYYRADKPITLTIDESIWWDGGTPVAVSVTVGDTCYLDFDTGKANLLYYVQNIMK